MFSLQRLKPVTYSHSSSPRLSLQQLCTVTLAVLQWLSLQQLTPVIYSDSCMAVTATAHISSGHSSSPAVGVTSTALYSSYKKKRASPTIMEITFWMNVLGQHLQLPQITIYIRNIHKLSASSGLNFSSFCTWMPNRS